jgi:hypothetical protein
MLFPYQSPLFVTALLYRIGRGWMTSFWFWFVIMNNIPHSVRQVLFIKSVLSIDQGQSFYRFLINPTEMTVPQALAVTETAVKRP